MPLERRLASSCSHWMRFEMFSSFFFLFISLPNSALSLGSSFDKSCDIKNGASDDDATEQLLSSMSFT